MHEKEAEAIVAKAGELKHILEEIKMCRGCIDCVAGCTRAQVLFGKEYSDISFGAADANGDARIANTRNAISGAVILETVQGPILELLNSRLADLQIQLNEVGKEISVV